MSDESKVPDDSLQTLSTLRAEVAALRAQLASTQRNYSHFVPQQILNFLNIQNICDVRLGLQTERHMSIVFADIRDFTAQSERMTPQENFNFLNSFLSQMEPVIGLNKGVIDKFIGDAIMALFPESVDDALLAALGMLERLEEYNHGRARAGYAATRIGVGINTGIVMLGTVGGANRMEGTVISDAVNVASRLEGLTKLYGAQVLISEHTLHALDNPDQFLIRFIDRVCVRGKHEPQSIYEVFDGDPPTLRLAKKRTLRTFEEALAYYHMRDIPHARTKLLECLDEAPGDLPARHYLDRCDEYLHTGYYQGDFDGSLAPVWQEEYGVGANEEDTDKQNLLVQLGQLATFIRDGQSVDALAMLRNIRTLAAGHFDRQSALIRQYGYPFQREHEHQHLAFQRQLSHVQERLESFMDDPVLLAFQVRIKLCDFLINHNLKFDRHFHQYRRQQDAAALRD